MADFEAEAQGEEIVDDVDVDVEAGEEDGDVEYANQLAYEPYRVDIKLFNKWNFDEVEINDISLLDFFSPNFNQAYAPHTAGRYQKKRFRKAKCPIVERLCCSLMRRGRNSGKKLMAARIVQHTLEIVHVLSDQNPLQVPTYLPTFPPSSSPSPSPLVIL
jgi:small subunit ribosomal protein S5e